MAWISITEADLLTVMNGPELDAIRAAALAAGQVDPVAPTITQVTDQVRGFVAGSGQFSLGVTGIPQKLLAPALDMIAFRIPSRVGRSPGDTRSKLNDQALDLMRLVAAGKYGIEEPEVVEEAAGGVPVTYERTLSASRDNQDGL